MNDGLFPMRTTRPITFYTHDEKLMMATLGVELPGRRLRKGTRVAVVDVLRDDFVLCHTPLGRARLAGKDLAACRR